MNRKYLVENGMNEEKLSQLGSSLAENESRCG